MVLNTRRRRAEIVRLSTAGASLHVAALSERFEVSPSTIRRDLAHLESEGQITRTYGGAVATGSPSEPGLSQRLGEAHVAKLAIGSWAADQIAPGDSIALDAGSTVMALAHRLRNRSNIAVTTTSLSVLQELSRSENLAITALGGSFRPVSHGFVGPLTQMAVETLTFDRAFLGADSVDATLGICEADAQQTTLKLRLAARSTSVYVLAHASKLGRRPYHSWAALPLPWTLVTDADEQLTAPFVAEGVTVARVNPHGEG
ncbi:DeoR/GlpR family DNA-binding transcription regulator [Microbacterium sp. JZ101]